MSAKFEYQAEGSLRRKRIKVGRGLSKHESWADAILPADAAAGPVHEPVDRKWLAILVGASVIACLALVVRLAVLQLAQGKYNLSLAEGNRLRQTITRSPRGVLYDRNGQLLVRNQPVFDVTVVPSRLEQTAAKRQVEYAKLATLIGKPAVELQKAAEAKSLLYAQPILLASELPRNQALQVEEAIGELPGFNLDVNSRRQYLADGSLSSLLGYTGRISAEQYAAAPAGSYQPTDFAGQNGLEKQYEQVLRGKDGFKQTEVDVTEKPVKVLASTPSVPGDNLVLTIDKDLQAQLVSSIQAQMQAAGSTRAAGVIINPQNGEVLAMASVPGYDNNLFANGISQADYTKLINDPAQPLFNKAVQGAYPTGSIIKPLVATAALTEKTINTSTSVDDKGFIEVPNQYDPKTKYTFRSYEPGGLGSVNVSRAIKVSSNVFFYSIGGGYGSVAGLGVKRLDSWYQKFGLGSPTGIDVPGEGSGLVPSPDSKQKATKEPWTLGDTYNISVGQGDLRASPLQMAVAEAAVANGGTVYKPHLVSKITDDNGKLVQTIKPQVVRNNIASPEALSVVRAAMRSVVAEPGGTACCKIEQDVPVQVAAKTGTAETDPDGKRKPHAWFTAFAPYDNPRFLSVVLIENSGEGAQYAAPATREVLKWYFTHR